jgi:hypothetical protein
MNPHPPTFSSLVGEGWDEGYPTNKHQLSLITEPQSYSPCSKDKLVALVLVSPVNS